MSLSDGPSPNGMRQLNLLDLFQCYPIFERLCAYMPIAGIIYLTQTCKALSHLYQTLLGLQQWNVDRDLLRFVEDPRRFRTQLGKCDGLISGSFALQFFERVYWEGSDLDIFVEDRIEAQKFEHYLSNVENYELSKESSHNDYGWGGPARIRTFLRSASKDASPEQIQIIASQCPPVQNIINGFHSSIAINCLTWSKAYAIFPQSTFIHRDGLAFGRQTELSESHVEKYRKRKYRISKLHTSDRRRLKPEIAQIRRVGDKWTWTIAFDSTGLKRPKTPDSVLEYSAFGFETQSTAFHSAPYALKAFPFEACVLQHQYTHPSCPDFFESIQAKLDQLTIEELHRLPERMRPSSYIQMIGYPRYLGCYRDELLVNGTSILKCYDDQIPQWYAEWEQHTPRAAKLCIAPDDNEREPIGIDLLSLENE